MFPKFCSKYVQILTKFLIIRKVGDLNSEAVHLDNFGLEALDEVLRLFVDHVDVEDDHNNYQNIDHDHQVG